MKSTKVVAWIHMAIILYLVFSAVIESDTDILFAAFIFGVLPVMVLANSRKEKE